MPGHRPPDLAGGHPEDQAAGLRRMFAERPPQVVAFASGQEGSGRAQLLIKTALDLGGTGRRVIVIDESPGTANVAAGLGVRTVRDLWDGVMGKAPILNLLAIAAPNVAVVSAATFSANLRLHTDRVAETMRLILAPLQAAAHFVLIDSYAPPGSQLSPLSVSAEHMVLVIAAEKTAITQGYALIKRLARERGKVGFQVAVTGARGEKEARTVFDNLRRTAMEHLGVRIDYLGAVPVPATGSLADALESCLPIAPRQRP